MPFRASREDWGSVAKILHWVMAVGIVVMIVCGIAMARLLSANIGLKFAVYQFHKSLGIVLLCAAVLRLIWRLTSANRLDHVLSTRRLERRLAEATHIGLYVCLIAQPLIGWAAASASPLNIPTVIFGLFTLPRLGQANAGLERLFNTAHGLVAFTLMGLLTLHAAAALWHHFIRRDDTLFRILPRSWRSARITSRSSNRYRS